MLIEIVGISGIKNKLKKKRIPCKIYFSMRFEPTFAFQIIFQRFSKTNYFLFVLSKEKMTLHTQRKKTLPSFRSSLKLTAEIFKINDYFVQKTA
jgi:hypothetical protein